MKKQIRVYYTGKVQGEGFRFTVINIATRLGVTGWVKNMVDSRVEVVAEAQEDVLKDFLAKINQSFSRYIENTEVGWQEATDKFKDFGLKF